MNNFAKIICLCSLLIMISLTSHTQDLGFGFRAGWSYTSFEGPLLEGEKNTFQSGIHIGPTMTMKITDRFGLHSGLFYSQGGNEYSFKGEGYNVFINDNSRKIISGDVDKTLLVENTYIDIPLGVYFYVTDHIQLFGGINIDLLVSSSARGTYNFNNPQYANYETVLDHKYFKDEPGDASEQTVFGPIRIEGQTYSVPEFLGAYYFHESKAKNLYRSIDFGVHAGFRYFLNSALYFSVRAYYGLTDINNDEIDLSPIINKNEPNKLQFQSDIDRNLSFQLSLGFAF